MRCLYGTFVKVPLRVVAIPELLGGTLFGIFESQGGRVTPKDPSNFT